MWERIRHTCEFISDSRSDRSCISRAARGARSLQRTTLVCGRHPSMLQSLFVMRTQG